MIIKTNQFKFNTKNSILSFNDFKTNYELPNLNYFDFFTKLRKQEIIQYPKRIKWISLIPTLKCEGNCPYCYNKEEREKNKFLTIEQLEQVLKNKDFDFSTTNMIRVYGGEPLLHPNLFEIINYLKNHLPNLKKIYLSTGLLFSNEHFQKIIPILKKIEKIIDLTIGTSLDWGVPDDKFTRISYKNNIYKKEQLLERIFILQKELKSEIVFPTVISKYTNINLLIQEVEKYDIKNTKFRFEIANDDIYQPTKEQLIDLYKFLEKNIDNNRIYAFVNTDILNLPKTVKIDNNNFWLLFPHSFCGIYSNMISINPYNISPCHTIPNQSYNKIKYKHLKWFFNNEKCKKCDFYSVCRGLCVSRQTFAPKAIDNYCLWSKLSFIISLKQLDFKYKNLKEIINKKSIIIKGI